MTPSQKLRSIADSTGLDGIADAIREIANEIEHNNAPADICPLCEPDGACKKRMALCRANGTAQKVGAPAPAVPQDILARACNLAGLPYETFLKIKAFLPVTHAPSQEPAVPQGWKLVQTPITEEMHVAAVKVLHRAPGLAGLPQRMLDAMLAATPAPAPAQEVDEAQIQKLRENGAKAWAGVDAQQLRAGFAAPSQEPVACGLCQGSGVLSPTQKCICQYGGKEPAQEAGLTDVLRKADEFNRYFTSGNNVDVPARISVLRDEWRDLYAALRAKWSV